MGYPPQTDALIRKRFDELLNQSQHLLQDYLAFEKNRPANFDKTYTSLLERYYDLRTQFISLLKLLSKDLESFKLIIDELQKFELDHFNVGRLRGFISGLKSDYEVGILENISEIVEASVVSDFLGQAEQLLKEGQPGKYDHVPAAVLTGAILEDALRRLCQRQRPPIPMVNAKGENKTLNPLIDDLAKANLFNKMKVDQLEPGQNFAISLLMVNLRNSIIRMLSKCLLVYETS